MSKFLVRQVRGLSGQSENQRRIIKALGLKRINDSRLHKDNNCVRGMLNKIKHLVTFEVVKD